MWRLCIAAGLPFTYPFRSLHLLLFYVILMGMKELMINILKPFSFLPAILIMYAIFTLSGQPGNASADLSYKVSYKIVELKSRLANEYKDEYQLAYEAELIHGKVRKAAHMTEYFCLAIAVSFPFYVYGLRGIPLMLVAGVICVGFAGLDEYHQSFVAGRGPSKRDVAIDSIGIFFGILAVRIFCWIFLLLLPKKRSRRR